MEETFTDVYNRNEWLIDSGPGSTIEYNKDVYIPFLKNILLITILKKYVIEVVEILNVVN